ncbi:hypothetical protein B0J11DRAFT_127024 [Dendryphion nanum]|uniref:Uncharacterized protein n=1 Tax=Dendryphion nanum TaxID=256645 RepID=A0A9P9D9T1_9PLEO|nr:hypothetical protein B0J11DRAFT_127024 [Dendryphion nanum]
MHLSFIKASVMIFLRYIALHLSFGLGLRKLVPANFRTSEARMCNTMALSSSIPMKTWRRTFSPGRRYTLRPRIIDTQIRIQ